MDSQSSSPVEVQTVDVHGAKELISSGHRYLDVRTEEEFNKGHVNVENALNIPYMFNTPQGRVKNPKFMEQVLSVCNKEDPLVVGCQTGVRSVYATTDLLNADFKHVSNMGGGYVAWVENGFAVKNPIYNSPVEVQTVDVYEAKELISSGHRYLDVRTEEEFNKGHVDVEIDPLNIPYMFNAPQGRVKNPKFMEQVLSVCNKEDPLVVGCQTGVRSVYATTDLLNADFKHVINMGGGYVAWLENGFAVTKP